MQKEVKYIFVVGGVMSGVGKGVATASIGKILQSKGFKVTAIKVDPYINVDAGTMNPVEHGEVFVTDDGDETDQDIGNYERFLDVDITSANYMTTGRVYQSVINRERNLEYGGKCVEVVPHVPEEIIRRIKKAAEINKADFVMVEIGGTVGEYQNILFLEAARMMHLKHPKDVLFVLVSYLPVPNKIGEMKTKPTQYAARTLASAGIQADFILCRSSQSLDEPRKRKLGTFCSIPEDHVVSAPDVDSIYDIPINFEKEGLGDKILECFDMHPKKQNMRDWRKFVSNIHSAEKVVRIGIIGKYFATGSFTLSDSYISVIESVKHACAHHNVKPVFQWINSEAYENHPRKLSELKKLDGIIVPGGFGTRGIEGKILAIEYVRKRKIPFLGLCYGMQLATVEFARNKAGIKEATTEEVDADSKFQIIHIMKEQKSKLKDKDYGGSMRLGAYPCVLNQDSLSYQAYGKVVISERHRHRYEFNNSFREKLEKAGMLIAGTSPDNKLVEIIEIKKHPFFVGVQFHPEFKSRPLRPHPLFRDFIGAMVK